MKVLLIQPPIQDFYRTSIRTQPIGLAYLASSLQSDGFEVEILDCQTERKRSIPIPPELSYLQEFYPFQDRSPLKLYTGFYHFGMDRDEIRKRIEDSRADVFGISCSFTPYSGEALEIARIIKTWDGKKIVVMGGAHVSCDPESVLKSPFVDCIVLGEGEARLPYLLRQLMKKGAGDLKEMDGVGYRSDGRIKINPLRGFIRNLDALPYPARELLDLDRYRIEKRRSTMIITSRGCPHGCAYCSARLVMGVSFRARSPEAILQEMAICRKQFDIRAFDIEDDNFTFDQERAKRLMKLIIDTFGEESPALTAMNGVSIASLDRELLQLMKKAGFKTINLSLVSADRYLKRIMKRPVGPIDFDQVLKEAEQVGLHVVAYAILGMPGQTTPEMADTLVNLMGKQVLIGPSIYYPTPGTPLFEKCQEDGLLPPHSSQWRSSAIPVETGDFTRIDLLTLFRLARTINFIKGKIDCGELNEGVTWRELWQILKGKGKVNEIGILPTWAEMLLLLFEERSFFSLRKGIEGNYSLIKEGGSRRAFDSFFQKAMEEPILGSR